MTHVDVITQFKNAHQRACDAFCQHPNSTALSTQLCLATDTMLITLWQMMMQDTETHQPSHEAVLLAVGGYGRKEFYPYSDIDILIIHREGLDSATQDIISQFIQRIWDCGLTIGHSVRTIDECLEESKQDISVQTSLLEARYLTGKRVLLTLFQTRFYKHLDLRHFLQVKQLEQQQRHLRFNETPFSLEPNCKESPGGLRDLHVIAWLLKAAENSYKDRSQKEDNTRSTAQSSNHRTYDWRNLARQDLITPAEARQLQRNQRIITLIRCGLHIVAKRREDRIIFDVQDRLARLLSNVLKLMPVTLNTQLNQAIQDHPHYLSERLMQTYYRAVNTIWQLNKIVLHNLSQHLFPIHGAHVHIIDDDFQITNQQLELRHPTVFSAQPLNLLRIFIIMQQHPEAIELSPNTLRELWHARTLINNAFRRNPQAKQLFLQFWQQPRGIVHELRRMTQTGILGQFLPVFGKIVGQMQHDLFHIYTVDQHILQVIRNLRRFTMPVHAHEYPLCSRLMAEWRHPWLLYLAALFHDIAKGRGGDHSVLGQQEALKFGQHFGLAREHRELIAFLVAEHLTMSSVAQKQDLSDSTVIAQFAQRVHTPERLTALYLLTVADVRGTSPKVWNAWKGQLLETLYHQTLRYLGGQQVDTATDLAQKKEAIRAQLQLHTVPVQVENQLWTHFSIDYFLQQDTQAIAWHTRHLWQDACIYTQTPIIKSRPASFAEGLEVMIYTADQSNLFGHICQVFETMNLSVVDARIYTTQHGYALDHFLVINPIVEKNNADRASLHQEEYRTLCHLIENRLTQALVKPYITPSTSLLGRIASRQSRHFPISPTVHLKPDEKGQRYILSFTTMNRTGLLASITNVLAQFKLNIHTAKIMTLGERVEDTFVISGATLQKKHALLELQSTLLDTLKTA
jgi:[protein-PII] uridylyltransferase